MLIKIPKIISSEKQLKEALNSNKYSVVEGEVENFLLKEINGQYFESFRINNKKFEYSDNISIGGFHQTSKKMGPIKKNGQYLRISFLTLGNKNLILKIEMPKAE